MRISSEHYPPTDLRKLRQPFFLYPAETWEDGKNQSQGPPQLKGRVRIIYVSRIVLRIHKNHKILSCIICYLLRCGRNHRLIGSSVVN